MNPHRLVFRTTLGATKARSVSVRNTGTAAVYFHWEIAREVELMLGHGANRASIQGEGHDPFDWYSSETFSVPRNLQSKTRSEFCFTQFTGSIRPGCAVTFNFAFKSDVPGCFTQRWIMRTTPTLSDPKTPLSVSLRGCCEVNPPDLSSFKTSIEGSLHESERTRCINEILGAVVDRVEQICDLHRRRGEDRIDGEVLVDDRAPTFDAANRQWNLIYSPALYAALRGIAEECWDALKVANFDRFWDFKVTSLSTLAMRIPDGGVKRRILAELNKIVSQGMTASTAGSLAYSVAYVQVSTMLEDLPEAFLHDAAVLKVQLPFFLVPKMPDPGQIEDELESAKRRHRSKGSRKVPPPAKKPVKKGGKEEETAAQAMPEPVELSQELKGAIRETIKSQIKERLLAFENLASESRAVGQQLTRVNEIERLETNLDAEVEDDV
jgi:hypothetical protein